MLQGGGAHTGLAFVSMLHELPPPDWTSKQVGDRLFARSKVAISVLPGQLE